MQLKIDRMLNVVIGSAVGVLIGHVLFKYMDYRNHPKLYAMFSAPWYTSSLVVGMYTLGLILIIFLLKVYFTRKKRNQE